MRAVVAPFNLVCCVCCLCLFGGLACWLKGVRCRQGDLLIEHLCTTVVQVYACLGRLRLGGFNSGVGWA